MAYVLSWERNQRCLRADLQHACLVIFDAHKKQPKESDGWPLAQMIDNVLSYLMLPAVVMNPVVARGTRTCVIDASGHLRCFGDNAFGQCDVPAGLGIVTQVAAGGFHTCVIDASGHLRCFGDNAFGQCDVPAGLGIVTQVAAGGFHTCVIDASGHLRCFGDNAFGQCDVPAGLGVVPLGSSQIRTRRAQASASLGCQGGNSEDSDISSEIGGNTAEVIQDVWHPDPAASIDPACAAAIAAAMESGMIERQAQSVACQLEQSEQIHSQLILLQFDRPTKALRDALRSSIALQQCRQALEHEGLPFEFPDGNMVFVEPEQHAAARQMPAIPGLKLNCFYVVVSPSMEHLIEESLACCGKGGWARLREELPPRDSEMATAEDSEQECASSSHSLYAQLQVVRTTFHFDLQAVRNEQSVTQSTTCAREGCVNHRRYK